MRTRWVFYIFCCFVAFTDHLDAQQKKNIDSILQVIIKTDIDSVKAWNYAELANITSNSNPFISKYYANKAKEIFNRLDHKSGLAIACLRSATALRMLNEEKALMEEIKRALSIAENTHDNQLLARCFQEMALISHAQNDFEKALSYNLKALGLRTNLKRTSNNENEVSGIYNNIGIQYAQKEQWNEAVQYFKRAIAYDEKTNSHYRLGNTYNNVGIYYIVTKKFDSAFYYLLKGKQYREELEDKLGIAGSCNNLALLYMQLDKPETALKYADTSLRLAKEIKNVFQEDETLLTLYEINSRLGNHKLALEYFLEHDKLQKKLESETNTRRLAEIQGGIELEMKQNEITKRDLQLQASEAENRKRNMMLFFSAGILVIAAFFIWYILKVNRKVKAANTIIKQQKRQTEIQKKIIEEKHKDITDSIYYAQKIQEALIIPEQQLLKSIPESFILYRPRDIVSGDFYWFAEKNGEKIFAVADCTGHGIPGAFMSLIGISSLNQIVVEKGITSPAQILNLLRDQVIKSFNQADEDTHRRDGMDIGILRISEGKVTYAGANNPCLMVRGSEIVNYSADKQPVGFHEHATTFNEQTILTQKGDAFYLFSDGIVDQFGGDKGKKVKIKYFKEWLMEIQSLEMKDQKKIIEEKLVKWKRGFDQTDDILVAGIKC